MWAIPDHFKVKFGGNYYIDTPVLVAHGSLPFVTVKRHDDNGYLGVYFDIFDASGTKLAAIRRNEIYPAARAEIDYKIDGSLDRMVLSERATGAVLCDIRKRDAAGNYDLDVSVRLYMPTGFLFDATPEQTNFGTVQFKGNTIKGCGVGIRIE